MKWSSLPVLPHAPVSRWHDPLAQYQKREWNPLAHIGDSLRTSIRPTRKPDAFYWKAGKPLRPTDELTLECEQWRHSIDPEEFEAVFHVDHNQDRAAGALTCRVEAENLSTPASLTIRVRITVRYESVAAKAAHAVDRLIARATRDDATKTSAK